ncbi:MAG: sulfur carrier protein ThiS [Polyangiaceae bacterium]|nr:sulfur carrier protein ThiS [Polyangiaceae bacterium]
MKLVVNGEETEVSGPCTVVDLLKQLGLNGPVAVECNREIVPRSEHGQFELSAGDTLELVHFVGGG